MINVIYELKKIGILYTVLISIGSVVYVAKLEDPPWYLWPLALFWLPASIATFLFGIRICERVWDRREAQKHLQRCKDRHERRHRKKRRKQEVS